MEEVSKKSGIKLSALIFIVMVVLALGAALRQQPETIEYPQAIAFFKELRVKAFTLDLNNNMLDMILTDNKHKQCQLSDLSAFFAEIDGENSLIDAYDKANPDAPMKYAYVPMKPPK